MAEVCRDYHLPGGAAPHTYTQIHTNCRVGRGNPPMGRNVQRRLFVATLVETCDRQGWRIHPKFSNSRQSIGRFGHPPRRPAQSPRAPRVNIWRASRSLAEKWGQKDSNPGDRRFGRSEGDRSFFCLQPAGGSREAGAKPRRLAGWLRPGSSSRLRAFA